MATVANRDACFGNGCSRKSDCLRHAVLQGDVPCFPVAENACGHGGDYAAFVNWVRDGRPNALPSLCQ